MATFTENTMFESHVSNVTRNGIQNVAGKFGTYTANTYAPLDCSAGMLCKQAALLPNSAYVGIKVKNASGVSQDILNSNAWYFIAAADGKGTQGDHTGIYAFCSYNVSQATNGDNSWNIGFRTLGLGLPAGETGNFTELIVGEEYAFGKGNFSTAPADAAYKYATIANGLLVASATAPAAGTGVYFEILRTEAVTEGIDDWGDKYIVKVKRTAAATVSGS